MARISLSLLSRVIMIALIFSTVVVAQPANSAALQEAAKLHAQVVQLYKENKLDEALPLAKRIVEIREKELSDGNHLLAVSYTNLAHIYRTKKKYDEAEKYFRRALKVEEKRLGKDHPELYDLLIEIA